MKKISNSDYAELLMALALVVMLVGIAATIVWIFTGHKP